MVIADEENYSDPAQWSKSGIQIGIPDISPIEELFDHSSKNPRSPK
jgi:hypothetical protein